MNVTASQASDDVRVVVIEEPTMELGRAAELRAGIAAQAMAAERVVLDLGAVRFIDSSGLGVLFSLVREANARGHKLALARPCTAVQRVFDMVHLERIVCVAPSIDDAVRLITQRA